MANALEVLAPPKASDDGKFVQVQIGGNGIPLYIPKSVAPGDIAGLGALATKNTVGVSDLSFDPATQAELDAEAAARASAVSSEAAARTAADVLALLKSANLSDVANAATARSNLGLGSSATHPAGDFDTAGVAAAEQARALAAEALLTPLTDPRLAAVGFVITETRFGAVPDLVRLNNGAITSGSAVLTSATAAWTSADVGKPIVVRGADAAGAALATTILSRQSATQVTLAASASTTVTAADVKYGTDNTAAIRAALAAASAAGLFYPNSDYAANGGSSVLIPPGVYGYTGALLIPHLVALRGLGHDVSALTSLAPDAHVRFANISGAAATSLNTTLQQGGSLTYPLSGATITVKDNPQTGGAFPAGGAAFTPTGSITIGLGAKAQTVTYTGITATGFTGVSGGTAGLVHADGQAIRQGSTVVRRSGLSGGFMLDGNNVSTPNGFLCVFGLVVQSLFADIFVSNSAGGGVLVASAQNNLFQQMQVQFCVGDGWTWDYGAGGNHRIKCEVNSNGDPGGYNEKWVQTGVSILGDAQPTSNTTDTTIFERVGGDGLGNVYFGAGSENDFNDCNFAANATTTLSAGVTLPAGTISLANTSRYPSTGGTAKLTDGVNTDTITFTGKTSTTLTGVTGGTHTFAALTTTVQLTSPKVSMLKFRKDATNGATQSSAWRFHNCTAQGLQGLTRCIDATGGVYIIFTGVNDLHIHDTVWYVDDAAIIQGLARESNFDNSFVSQGGVKTKDQVVRPALSPLPTTQGTPIDSTVQFNPPPQDGAAAVDNVNGILYFRTGAAYKRVANFSDLSTAQNTAGIEASIPSAVGSAGVIYYATDTRVCFLSNGTTWRPISWPGAYSGMPLVLANFGWDEITLGTVAMAGSGSDTLVGVYIPKFFVVTRVGIKSGNTAATFGSNNDGHWYTLIRDQSGALQCSSADQGIGSIAASAMKNLAVARDGANAAVASWTCPASAVYLCGANVYLGTGGAPVMPSLAGRAAMILATGGAFPTVFLSAAGQTGMTSGTPATTSTPVSALTNSYVVVTGS